MDGNGGGGGDGEADDSNVVAESDVQKESGNKERVNKQEKTDWVCPAFHLVLALRHSPP